MTTEEAVEQAAMEGLPLIRGRCASGYKGVSRKTSTRFAAISAEGNRELGRFPTAEQAALVYARHLGKEAAEAAASKAEAATDMTAAEALQQAATEGLTLVPAKGQATGFSCVVHANGGRFMVVVAHRSLGTFATAEHAALVYARHLGKEAAEAAAAKAEAATPSMTAAEAVQQATAEGLLLARTGANATGFKCVESKGGRFVLRVGRRSLGSFATAEQAALVYARHLGKDGAAAAAVKAASTKASAPRRDRPPKVELTSAEAVQQAAVEGLPLVQSASASGYKYVTQEGSRFVVNRHGGKGTYLGSFATAEEAALVFARHIGAHAAHAAQPGERGHVAQPEEDVRGGARGSARADAAGDVHPPERKL